MKVLFAYEHQSRCTSERHKEDNRKGGWRCLRFSELCVAVVPLFVIGIVTRSLRVGGAAGLLFQRVNRIVENFHSVIHLRLCRSQGQHFGCGQRFGYRIDDLVGVQAQIPAPSTSTIASSTMKTIIGSFARVVRNWTTQRTPLYG